MNKERTPYLSVQILVEVEDLAMVQVGGTKLNTAEVDKMKVILQKLPRKLPRAFLILTIQ